MLEINNIHTYRGSVKILRGVSLSVGSKEVVCLVGRNGAGKSTLVESIMGHLPVTSGSVGWKDNDITRLPAYKRARGGIGHAPDYSGIFPKLSVEENLKVCELIGKRSKMELGASRAQIYSVFPEIRNFTERQGQNLSGGQKKMVAISRAMSLSPELLLLDEAFEGLAPVIVSRFTEAVKKIKNLGISILIAESNVAAATQIADRIYAIDRGEIIFEGSPQEIVENEAVMRIISG